MTKMPQAAACVAAFAVLCSTFAVCAAAPEPTQEDIAVLAQRDVVQANAPVIEYMQRLGRNEVPQDMLVQLRDVRKRSCRAAAQEAWDCDVEMDMHLPNGGARTRTLTLHLLHTAEGWQASRLR